MNLWVSCKSGEGLHALKMWFAFSTKLLQLGLS